MTVTSRPTLEPPWGDHPLPSGETLDVRLGPLSLRVRCLADEIWLAHVSGDWRSRGGSAGRERPSEEESWIRWPVPDETEHVRFSPVFPPRTVVVKPEHSFRLLPGAHARIYVRVPLWVRVLAAAPDGALALADVPSVILSDTWWGEFTEGELCYWLSTSARRRTRPESFEPHLAVCPLELANRSDRELEVQKIALRVAHLSIFRDGDGFWSDVTRVRYRGDAEGSEIDVGGRAPDEAESGAVRVAEPHSPASRSFSARTFSRLRSLSGLGGTE